VENGGEKTGSMSSDSSKLYTAFSVSFIHTITLLHKITFFPAFSGGGANSRKWGRRVRRGRGGARGDKKEREDTTVPAANDHATVKEWDAGGWGDQNQLTWRVLCPK